MQMKMFHLHHNLRKQQFFDCLLLPLSHGQLHHAYHPLKMDHEASPDLVENTFLLRRNWLFFYGGVLLPIHSKYSDYQPKPKLIVHQVDL